MIKITEMKIVDTVKVNGSNQKYLSGIFKCLCMCMCVRLFSRISDIQSEWIIIRTSHCIPQNIVQFCELTIHKCRVNLTLVTASLLSKLKLFPADNKTVCILMHWMKLISVFLN